jgi:hypothetical protein
MLDEKYELKLSGNIVIICIFIDIMLLLIFFILLFLILKSNLDIKNELFFTNFKIMTNIYIVRHGQDEDNLN